MTTRSTAAPGWILILWSAGDGSDTIVGDDSSQDVIQFVGAFYDFNWEYDGNDLIVGVVDDDAYVSLTEPFGSKTSSPAATALPMWKLISIQAPRIIMIIIVPIATDSYRASI